MRKAGASRGQPNISVRHPEDEARTPNNSSYILEAGGDLASKKLSNNLILTVKNENNDPNHAYVSSDAFQGPVKPTSVACRKGDAPIISVQARV